MTELAVIGFSLLGSMGSLIGAGLLLAFPRWHRRSRTPLLAYAVGTLLGATFLGLLPEALAGSQPETVLAVTLTGFVVLFLIEKVLRLRHAHAQTNGNGEAGCDETGCHVPMARPSGTLILVGDGLHNLIDGVVIATACFQSLTLGIVTALAVVVHEIPQELGDFVILLESGWDRWRAYWANFLSGLGTLVGALGAIVAMDVLQPLLPLLLSLAAASFLYIATIDVAPLLHHEVGFKAGLRQSAFLLLGIGTVAGLHRLLG